MQLLSKTKIKNFLVVLLTVLLTISLALFAACSQTPSGSGDGDDTDNTETQETLTDSQLFKNGDFEFSTTEKTTFPYASSISWTRSYDSDKNSAPSSTISSGIIDTTEEVWAKLKDNEKPLDAEGNPVNPGTPYSKGLITLPEDAEETTEITAPQVDKNKILMIANKNAEDGLGTAQKFKSSSTITVPVDYYAIISLWVRTDNLKMKTGDDAGAYVLLTDKVGSTTYGNIEYRKINTNGEWKKIQTVVKGSSIGSVSLTLTVGLGRGNGTFKAEYVEGFAFFDNVEAKLYSTKEFKELNNSYTFKQANKNNLTVENYTTPTDNNTLTYAYSFEYKNNGTAIKENTSNPLGAPYGAGWYQENIDPTKNYILADLEGNKIEKTTVNSIKNSSDATISNIKTALEDIAITGVSDSDPVIYFNYAKASTGYYNTGLFDVGGMYDENLDKAKYHYITFYAKTKVSNKNIPMAKVEVVNITDDEEISSTSTAISSFTTTDVEDSAFGDWVRYSIIVSNPTDETTSYRLRFVFGDNESKLINDKFKLQEGYAIFAGFNVKSLSEEDFNAISTNSTNVKVSVYGKYSNYKKPTTDTEKQDSYFIDTDHFGSFEIENRPATHLHGITVKGDRTNTNIGIVNSKYNDNYTNSTNNVLTSNEAQVFANELKDEGTTYAQAILFKDNNDASKVSLLFPQKLISANTVGIISIKLRVLGDAVAKVRLVESTPNSDNVYETIKLSTDEFERPLEATVNKDSFKLGGYTEVFFYVAAGNKDITCRFEISFEKTGTIFVGKETEDLSSIATASDLDKEIDLLKDDFEDINLKLEAPTLHTRAPSKELYTDANGNDAERQITYEPTEVYTTNGLYTFVKFTTVDVVDTVDNRTPVQDDSHDHDHEHEHETDGFTMSTDVGLQISSIVLALALIAVLIVVLVRKTKKKTIHRKAKVESYYNRNTRDEAMAKIQKKKAEINLDKDENEGEYNYEEAEAINEEVEEEIVEETIEDVANETLDEIIEENQEENSTEENVKNNNN